MENLYSCSRHTYNAVGWRVWQTNLDVAEVSNDLGDLEAKVANVEKDVEEYEKNARTLIGVEKDIEHIRDAISRIEDLVTR